MGMAGTESDCNTQLFKAWAGEYFPSAEIYLDSDATIGLAAGTGGILEGIVLISGTGMIALAASPGKQIQRCGGWG